MPDPIPATAAPAAAAPSPTPPAAPAADAKPTTKELSSKLFTLLTAEPAPPTPKPDDKTAPGAAAAPAAAPAAGAPKDEKKDTTPEGGIKRRKEKQPADTGEKPPPVPKKEDLNRPAPSPGAAPTPAPAPKAEPTDGDIEKDLVEEERVLLEDARAAEKYLPEKYKGQAAKMTAFLKENVKRLAAVEKGELDGKPWEQADYEKWYSQSVPKISLLDQRQVQRLAVKDEVKKDFEPQIEGERHARWVDAEQPKIRAKGDDIYRKLSNSALPDEVVTAITDRTKGLTPGTPEYRAKIDEVQKDYALEFEIAQNVINAATSDIEEFHRLTTVNPATQKPIAAFDAANPVHERLVNMVTEICNDFKATGGAELKKDGKWFATREEWQGMAPEQRGPFWTFTNEQIIDRALGRVKTAVGTLVAQERQRLEGKYGFKRTIAAPAATAPAPAPAPAGAPPAPRSAPAGGGAAPQPTIGAALAGKLISQGNS